MGITARKPGEDDEVTQTDESAQVRPLLTEIDHVAIAVHDLDAAIDYYRETFGAVVDHREVVESDGVEEALLKVAESYVQLLTPTRDDSAGRQVPREEGRGPPPRRATGSPTAATALDAVKAQGFRVHRRGSPAPAPAAPPSPSSTPRTPSAP